MNEDMSEIFKKMNEMLKNDEVPDSVNFLWNQQLQRIQSNIFQIFIYTLC